MGRLQFRQDVIQEVMVGSYVPTQMEALLVPRPVNSFLDKAPRLVEQDLDVDRLVVIIVPHRGIAREEEVLPLGTIALMVRSGTIVPVVNNFPLTNKPIVFIVGLNDTDK